MGERVDLSINVTVAKKLIAPRTYNFSGDSWYLEVKLNRPQRDSGRCGHILSCVFNCP
jgi:hypothetical protein